MKLCLDLEVVVNGDETFFVNKEILYSFSGKLKRLLSKAAGREFSKTLKLDFNDLPGGSEAFELLTRFCYNNGRIQITPINTCVLYFIAQFMELTEKVDSFDSLIKEIERAVEFISSWSWNEVLNALKQCQNYLQLSDSSGIIEKVIDSIVARISSTSDASPSNCSPDSSTLRMSFDTKSSIGHHRAWWFEELVVLKIRMIEKVVGRMICMKLVEHAKISKFLFYYLKCKFSNLGCPDEKKNVTETIIDLFFALDVNSVSCKGLLDVLRISSCQNLSFCCRERLEIMIGSRIDQASLDNLLISSPTRSEGLYDVNILLRFIKHFVISCGGRTSLVRLKKVASLVDLYMAEVAPDILLKHSKFLELITALPDNARDSHDSLYRAIDMYLEAHNRLSEEEKMKICSAINYEKLSLQSCKHLAQNSKFPPRTAVQALLSQQSKLKGLLQDSNNHYKSFDGEQNQSKDGDQVILCAKKVDTLIENKKLKAHLQGMQFRVMELEKVCRKMQDQMSKLMKTKATNQANTRSLPRLCS